ncbi:hypothetical protein MUGA111182_19890 [Mucilaginibacter galii]|uniref:Uncharacterized protein n=1 Tax=Mucilaginibacter galii TaxID=2005073 RepID=A0A917JES0_9SPHI|nr:hypothetical protein GCM10011425_36060 [Mucilaginibacter galii]
MKEKKQHSKRIDDITIAEVKSCSAFAHFTDEQAIEVRSSFKQFTMIMFDFFQRNQHKNPLNKD